MNPGATRGQPLMVFAAILGAWLGARVLLWQSPFPPVAPPPVRERDGFASARHAVRSHWQSGPARRVASARGGDGLKSSLPAGPPAALPSIHRGSQRQASVPTGAPADLAGAGTGGERNMQTVSAATTAFRVAGGPAEAPVADRPLLGEGQRASVSRWSADGWVMLRNGSGPAAAPGAASYGRSQAGAVVRYRLAQGGARPETYGRVTRTLEGPRQDELAAGLSLRPVPALPLRLAAEGRVSETAAGREVRPAVFAVTELPPARLPHGLRAEGYAQAGWVGGRFATAFVDGQARIDGKAARLGPDAELRAGLAAWGGAQRDAARFDVGPSATLALKLGEVRSRLAIDYRVRVAGDAEPASGPALTFSAGF